MNSARLLVLLIGLSGCGYSLVGRGQALPPSIRTLAVPVFADSGQRPAVAQRLAEAVSRELSGRGGVSVVSDRQSADAVLEGELSSYNAWPTNLDQNGRATEYQLIVSAAARVVTTDGEILHEIKNFRFQERYEVEVSGAYSDLENAAVEALAERFAQSLVAALIEGF